MRAIDGWQTVRDALGDTARTVRLIAILVTCAAIVAALAILGMIAYVVWHLVGPPAVTSDGGTHAIPLPGLSDALAATGP